MANLEHVAKLQEGVQAWNAWRAQTNVWVDLRKADLAGAYLVGANLAGANFVETNLTEAHLTGANLAGAHLARANLGGAHLGETNLSRAYLARANLVGANFAEANLARANLDGADLSGANLFSVNLAEAHLDGADLGEANLRKVNLSGANLRRADLREVRLYETIFANVDLTEVKSLDSCRHAGPSTIDHRTLARSSKLPLLFLRGCGLPNTLIDYLPSLLNQPIQLYSCFISYSSKDEVFAQRLHADLQDRGVRCWFAPEDMKIGDKIRTRIDEVIRIHDKLLLVLSENSVASTWVEKEVETALDKENKRKELVLFPIRLDGAVMESETGWAADIRRTRHIGNFSNWKSHDEYQKGLKRLLRDLKREKISKSQPGTVG